MPTYTYYCETCDEEKVRIVHVSVRDIVVCEDCYSIEPLKRKIDMPERTWGPTRNR